MKQTLLFTYFIVLASAFSALAQAYKETTIVPVTGNFYETGKLELTVAHIKTLKLPTGFQIAKFVEVENPRMRTVEPNVGDKQ